MNEYDRDLLGIKASNAWGNIFSYSLLAAHSLDMTASAAGRIDVEAARQIRMAQNMIRTRIDILAKESLYGYKKENGKEIRLKVCPDPFKGFSSLQVACSIDTAKLQNTNEAKKNSKDVANALFALEGGKTEISGALISNMVEIVKTELAFYRMPLEQAVRPISKEQQCLMNSLKIAAVIIADLINQALERIKDKLEERQDLYLCENCGMIYYELPEKCDVCEAGQSLIIKYPFPIKGDLADLEKYLYERYNPASNMK